MKWQKLIKYQYYIQNYTFLKNEDIVLVPDAAFFNALSLAVNFGAEI